MDALKPSRCPTILVVEDEELVGLFLQEALSEAGFDVTYCAESKLALQLLEQVHVCAAILDIGLPDLMGDELAALIRHRLPTLPIVLTTGFDHTVYQARFNDDPWTRVIGKPFDEPALLVQLATLSVISSTTRSGMSTHAGFGGRTR